MPIDTASREQRQQAIREILATGTVRDQAELLVLLRARGHAATQSSVSRDLREVGAAKVKGAYVLIPEGGAVEPRPVAIPRAIVAGSVLGFAAAGPHLVVVHTVVGAASTIGVAIDDAHWPEVVGTVAGDDTLFVATNGRRGQQAFLHRLQLLKEGALAHV